MHIWNENVKVIAILKKCRKLLLVLIFPILIFNAVMDGKIEKILDSFFMLLPATVVLYLVSLYIKGQKIAKLLPNIFCEQNFFLIIIWKPMTTNCKKELPSCCLIFFEQFLGDRWLPTFICFEMCVIDLWNTWLLKGLGSSPLALLITFKLD